MAIGDSTRINSNIAAENALLALRTIDQGLQRSQLRLATGLRINEVADDPAGFVISRRLGARARGLAIAYDNVGTVKSVLSIAESGLFNIGEILVTIKEKITMAANDTWWSAERHAIKTEINQLVAEIDDIVTETTFNNVTLLNGTYSVSYQTGEGTTDVLHFAITQSSAATSLSVDISNVATLIFTHSGASTALTNVNTAIETIADMMQKIGATVSRLAVKEATLSTAITNTQATRSRILDADIAREQLKSTQMQILQQTATAQMAQTSISPGIVLALFL